MKRTKKLVLVLALCVILFGTVSPVRAGRETYNDDDPDVIYGNWEDDYDATEEEISGNYRCVFTFEYNDIRLDGYDYFVNIDYDGVSPGWIWGESLQVKYKWDGGTWKHLLYLDWITSDQDWPIDDATSSTLYLRFIDYVKTGDNVLHTWYFGDTPYAICDY